MKPIDDALRSSCSRPAPVRPRTGPAAPLGARLFMVAAAALGVRCSTEGLTPSQDGTGGSGIGGPGVGGEGPSCSTPAPGCAERASSSGDVIICSDVAVPASCVGGAWTCGSGYFISQCTCFGQPSGLCFCDSSGWHCDSAGTGGYNRTGTGGMGWGGSEAIGGAPVGTGGRGTGGVVLGEPGGRGVGGFGVGGMGTGGAGTGGAGPIGCPTVGPCQPGQAICYTDVDESVDVNNPVVTYSCMAIPSACTGGALTCQCLCDQLCPTKIAGACSCNGSTSPESAYCKRFN